MLYDSIIPCFGSRFTVTMMPHARRYRVFPLGTFHYFDWQKTDTVGISIGTCPQIVTSESARIGVSVGGTTRILPFAAGETFADFAAMEQHITPLTTVITAHDPALPVTVRFTFRSAFYPGSFRYSAAPAYCLEVELTNRTGEQVNAAAFFGLDLDGLTATRDGLTATTPLHFPPGIDHAGIDGLTFSQVLAGDGAGVVHTRGAPLLRIAADLAPREQRTLRFYHAGYIPQPTLNRRGTPLKFGYTTEWDSAADVLRWWNAQHTDIVRKGTLFEETVTASAVPPALKDLLAGAFKGVACNAWWAEEGWFSVMEIGAYHATLDVDYQLALFFFQYWPELIGRMLTQWAEYYQPGSGYMAHDVGQHLEATGNRYGGPGSAMKVEENCNYLILLHHYWRATGDAAIFQEKGDLIAELVDFLIAADTTGSGLPNRHAENTNDWGSGIITASEEQSYHAVRLVVAYRATIDIAQHLGLDALAARCQHALQQIERTLAAGWLGDHYPISFSDPASYHHYSMWTAHGLLYALRADMPLPLDLERQRIDLISSTARTLREHGCVHSTADVRGWLTQNLWRDCIAAYLGVDHTGLLRRYLGHGEYVSYEDTTILEVANELMVVPGAVAEHRHAGETHDFPMVDGHPRPACGFGLLYALAGLRCDAVDRRLSLQPVSFPLRVALTHLADWEHERVPWVTCRRSIPNQDAGPRAETITYTWEHESLLAGWQVDLHETPTREEPHG